MATTFTALKVRFNTWLRDTQNLTFTDDEKTELLTAALNDPLATTVVRDTSLTTIAGTYSYTAPTGIGAIYELGLDLNGDGIFHLIPREQYDLINGAIYFNTNALPAGKTIQIVGKSKLDATSADIPVKVQDYVLHIAMVNAFEMLKTSLTTRFVKNDMTMSDIINSINTHKQEAVRLRQDIINQRLVTL